MFGALSALVGIALSGAFLAVVGPVEIGRLEPFTELTADGVHPLTAATWTYFDVLGVSPVVRWDNVVVRRGVLEMLALHGYGENFSVLRVVPPILLSLAGGVTAVFARRLRRTDHRSTHRPAAGMPVVGGYIALGYTPLVLLALWAATVPVAPDATGTVEIGNTITNAADLEGVTGGPVPFLAILAALAYPLIFGPLGGWLVERMSGEASEAGLPN